MRVFVSAVGCMPLFDGALDECEPLIRILTPPLMGTGYAPTHLLALFHPPLEDGQPHKLQ